MKTVSFPYGKEFISYDFKFENFLGTLSSSLNTYKPKGAPIELVRQAMENPIGSPSLKELVRGKKNIVIIASDHTRPVPSKVIIPPMLEQIYEGSPDAVVTILIATGCHRETTKEELIAKFGTEVLERVKIVVHDCTKNEDMVHLGTLPSGGALLINKVASEADILLAEGFIEPHFFAGFSGGRKSVLPGIAARETVLANHCSEFIASPKARTGILEGNPIHEDMIWAAKKAKLAYIVNVVINEKKEAIYAVAGDVEKAHIAGTEFLKDLCRAEPKPADIVITTNGGYPLDQNIYQSVKGMTAAEATVNEGGVIIMLARANDGHGGEHFYKQLKDQPDGKITETEILKRERSQTLPDQWMTQIILRILSRASVVYVSEADEQMVKDMHMIPAKTLEDAISLAKKIIGKDNPTVAAIPDGVSVVVGSK